MGEVCGHRGVRGFRVGNRQRIMGPLLSRAAQARKCASPVQRHGSGLDCGFLGL